MGRFSVIISWRNRPELTRTLDANFEMFSKHDVDVIVVNCGGDPNMLLSATSGVEASVRIQHVMAPHLPFNRSLANNLGASYAENPWLFFLDADIVLQSDIFEETSRLLERNDTFVTVHRVYESEPKLDPKFAFIKALHSTRELILLDGRRAVLHTFFTGDGSRGGPGLLLMNKTHFLQVGGFNSALQGWGYEDLDLAIRLQVTAALIPEEAGEVLHLSHGDDTRCFVGASTWENLSKNQALCTDRYSGGHFTGSYAEDQKWRETVQYVTSGGDMNTPCPASSTPD